MQRRRSWAGRALSVGLLGAVLAGAPGCSSDDTAGNDGKTLKPGYTGPVARWDLQPGAEVIPQALADQITTAPSYFQVPRSARGADALATKKPGQVLLSPPKSRPAHAPPDPFSINPHGFLRKVKAIRVSDDVLVVETEPASLTEAFVNLEILYDGSKPVVGPDIQSTWLLGAMAPGLTPASPRISAGPGLALQGGQGGAGGAGGAPAAPPSYLNVSCEDAGIAQGWFDSSHPAVTCDEDGTNPQWCGAKGVKTSDCASCCAPTCGNLAAAWGGGPALCDNGAGDCNGHGGLPTVDCKACCGPRIPGWDNPPETMTCGDWAFANSWNQRVSILSDLNPMLGPWICDKDGSQHQCDGQASVKTSDCAACCMLTCAAVKEAYKSDGYCDTGQGVCNGSGALTVDCPQGCCGEKIPFSNVSGTGLGSGHASLSAFPPAKAKDGVSIAPLLDFTPVVQMELSIVNGEVKKFTFDLGGDITLGVDIKAKGSVDLDTASKLASKLTGAAPQAEVAEEHGPALAAFPLPLPLPIELIVQIPYVNPYFGVSAEIGGEAEFSAKTTAKLGVNVSYEDGQWSSAPRSGGGPKISVSGSLVGSFSARAGIKSEVDLLIADIIGPYVDLDAPYVQGTLSMSLAAGASSDAPDAICTAQAKAEVVAGAAADLGVKVQFLGFIEAKSPALVKGSIEFPVFSAPLPLSQGLLDALKCINCKPVDGPDASCTTGAECCSGVCKDGSCAAAPATAPCHDASDCTTGACLNGACHCSAKDKPCGSDADCCEGACGAGKICKAPTCATTHAECASDGACCSGKCEQVSEGGVVNSRCACSTTSCSITSDCCAGMTCDPASKTCTGTQCSVAGEPCSGSGGSCCSGACDGGACACGQGPDPAKGVLAASCSKNQDCCTGSCVAGKCAPPPACKSNGAACSLAAPGGCCSGGCDPHGDPKGVTGACQCSTLFEPCNDAGDCCSGSCVNHVCLPQATGCPGNSCSQSVCANGIFSACQFSASTQGCGTLAPIDQSELCSDGCNAAGTACASCKTQGHCTYNTDCCGGLVCTFNNYVHDQVCQCPDTCAETCDDGPGGDPHKIRPCIPDPVSGCLIPGPPTKCANPLDTCLPGSPGSTPATCGQPACIPVGQHCSSGGCCYGFECTFDNNVHDMICTPPPCTPDCSKEGQASCSGDGNVETCEADPGGCLHKVKTKDCGGSGCSGGFCSNCGAQNQPCDNGCCAGLSCAYAGSTLSCQPTSTGTGGAGGSPACAASGSHCDGAGPGNCCDQGQSCLFNNNLHDTVCCKPACDGKCGGEPNGCGGVCPDPCSGQSCSGGVCSKPCAGSNAHCDGSGAGNCCDPSQVCSFNNNVHDTVCCTRSCNGKCGGESDGCGGVCQDPCPGQNCNAGVCSKPCAASGSHCDGSGAGNCCDPSLACVFNNNVHDTICSCVPSCAGKCGGASNGCGGTCPNLCGTKSCKAGVCCVASGSHCDSGDKCCTSTESCTFNNNLHDQVCQ